MTSCSPTTAPPILACVEELTAALEKAATASAVFLSPGEMRQALTMLARTRAMLDELDLRVLAAADRAEVGVDSGATSTGAWRARATRQTRPAAAADVRLARSLDEGHETTRAAFAAGALNHDQARAIVRAVEALPDWVTPDQVRRAEEAMVAEAVHLDAVGLRRLGNHLFEVIAPDDAERLQGEALEREEARARETASFTMRANGDGTHSGTFKISDLHAAMLDKVLMAITAPRRAGGPHYEADGKKVPFRRVLGEGFMELLEHLPRDGVPDAGGIPAIVVVTMTLQTLLDGLGTATLDDGTPISAGEARRLACRARIIPMVLDGRSVPLDVGLSKRLFDFYQRVAISHRDRTCRAEGCERPASMCEHHHERPFSLGGPTSVDNGGLRCGYHHRLDHDPAYVKTRLPSGGVRYRRRQ